MPHLSATILVVVAWCMAAPAQGRTATGAAISTHQQPNLQPGEEIRLQTPESNSFVVVYIPRDYTPDRPWPVIFCYHGASGRATTWPFRQVTDGKGFIVVGMNYLRPEYYRTLPLEESGPEREYFDEASRLVAKQLSIDPRMLFMGGFSQGGYSTSVLGEQLVDSLAGLILLGAGRRNVDRPPPNRMSLRGKPIFVGVGAKDNSHNQHARRAAKNYKTWGAKVAFEEWPERGHAPDEHSEKIRDWLLDQGPRKVFQADLTAARKAERSANLGTAYELYRQLSRFAELNEAATDAADAADKLANEAESQLAQAEAAITQRDKSKALALLKQIAKKYDGSAFGERATNRLNDLGLK